jgi:hypothetical protein
LEQAIQVLGAILVLIGYVLGQTGKVDTNSRSYLVINLVGSALLAAVAVQGRQWGFLVLNGTWAVISAVSLARQAKQASHADASGQ